MDQKKTVVTPEGFFRKLISFLLYWLAGGLLKDAKKEKMLYEEFNRDLFYYVVQVGLIINHWNLIENFSTNTDSLMIVNQIIFFFLIRLTKIYNKQKY